MRLVNVPSTQRHCPSFASIPRTHLHRIARIGPRLFERVLNRFEVVRMNQLECVAAHQLMRLIARVTRAVEALA